MSLRAFATMMRRTPGPARARPFSHSLSGALLERLRAQMGSESAELELKWMREELRARRAAAAPTTSSSSRWRKDLEWELGELRKMVDRRVKGEPLQYILGGYGSNSSRDLYRWSRPIAWASPGLVVSETIRRLV